MTFYRYIPCVGSILRRLIRSAYFARLMADGICAKRTVRRDHRPRPSASSAFPLRRVHLRWQAGRSPGSPVHRRGPSVPPSVRAFCAVPPCRNCRVEPRVSMASREPSVPFWGFCPAACATGAHARPYSAYLLARLDAACQRDCKAAGMDGVLSKPIGYRTVCGLLGIGPSKPASRLPSQTSTSLVSSQPSTF